MWLIDKFWCWYVPELQILTSREVRRAALHHTAWIYSLWSRTAAMVFALVVGGALGLALLSIFVLVLLAQLSQIVAGVASVLTLLAWPLLVVLGAPYFMRQPWRDAMQDYLKHYADLLCRHCRYDLAGLNPEQSSVCPECGKELDERVVELLKSKTDGG